MDDPVVTSCCSTAILPCSYNFAPLGHTQNTHILFHALEHCEVNISVLVYPRNAKCVLVSYSGPSVVTEQEIFTLYTIALSLVPRLMSMGIRLRAMV